MKILKFLSATFVIAIISLTCFFSFSVKGAWHYALSSSSTIEVPMSVEVFPWVGADELPNDVMGEDHQHLINKILNGTYTESNGSVTNIGLNNPDSYISNEISNRTEGNFFFRSDVLGSMDFWERNDISKFFDTATTKLSFLLHFPKNSDDTYYVYTTSVVLGDSTPVTPIGQDIYPIYRTTIQKNEEGVWVAVETKTGYAESSYYQNPVTGSWLVKYPSFNPDSWEEGHLGLTTDTAIYAAVGQTYTAYNKDTKTPKYYRLNRSSSGRVTIATQDSKYSVNVYDSTMQPVSTISGTKQGESKLTFNASANTNYYISISGGTSITFSVT